MIKNNNIGVLILTATVNVSSSKNVSIFDSKVRLDQYKSSLTKWVTKQNIFKRIVFIENSGFDLSYLSDYVNNIKHNKIIEFISFSSEKDKHKVDIGYGEMELIKRAIDTSKIIGSSFYKCTGRVYIKNIELLNLNNYDIFCNFRNNLVNVDSVFFGMNKDVFIDDVYQILFKEIEEGKIFEHGLAMGVHNAILNKKSWSPITPELYIDGICGGTGVHYMKNNPLYLRIVKNIANYLFFRAKYTYYEDGKHYYDL